LLASPAAPCKPQDAKTHRNLGSATTRTADSRSTGVDSYTVWLKFAGHGLPMSRQDRKVRGLVHYSEAAILRSRKALTENMYLTPSPRTLQSSSRQDRE